MRVVLTHRGYQRSNLRALELDEVAVEIEALGVGADANTSNGAVLGDAILDVDTLVAVGVEVGHDEEHDMLEPGVVATFGDLAHELQHRLFALDLPRVNVGVDEDAQSWIRGEGRRVLRERRIRRHDERQDAAFVAPPELPELEHGSPRRARTQHRIEEGAHVRVSGRLGEAAAFGRRLGESHRRFLILSGAAGRDREQGEQKGQQASLEAGPRRTQDEGNE
jgi:hypothetical protein